MCWTGAGRSCSSRSAPHHDGRGRVVRIHAEDPFATPEGDRSPLRRLRGRFAAPVSLWTAPGPAGLPVSSMLGVDGEPGPGLGLVGEESDLWAGIGDSGRVAGAPLRGRARQLAARGAALVAA